MALIEIAVGSKRDAEKLGGMAAIGEVDTRLRARGYGNGQRSTVHMAVVYSVLAEVLEDMR